MDVTFLARPARAAQLREHGLTVWAWIAQRPCARVLSQRSRLKGRSIWCWSPSKPRRSTRRSQAWKQRLANTPLSFRSSTGIAHVDELEKRFPGHVLGGIVRLVTTVDDSGRIVQLKPMASAARWHKWAFLVASGVATCLFRSSIGGIVAVPGGEAAIRRIVDECEAVATAAGYPVTAREHKATTSMLTEAGSVFTSSLYRDITAGRAGETEHLVGNYSARARALGAATPILDLALIQLRAAQASSEPGQDLD